MTDISAQLPWKVGVGLAVLAYLVLHYYASRTPLPANPADLKALGKTVGDTMVQSMWTAIAGVLQYLVPLALSIGALVSFMRRRRQSELHAQVTNDPSPNALEKMTWREFEGLAAETFRRQGYRVVERGGNGPDGGVDLELYMGSDKYLVQCKQWKSMKVGVATVRELYGSMTAERAAGGFVVASGTFTDEAKAFAEGRSIRLVDARQMRSLIGGVAAAADTRREPTASSGSEAPACPKCGSPMVRRMAKKGSMVGKAFWGCSKFPACGGIRN